MSSRDAAPQSLPLLCLVTLGAVILLFSFATGYTVGLSGEVGHTEPTGWSADATTNSVTATQNGTISQNTTFVIQLEADGDARWEIREQFDISTEERRRAFEDLAESFVSGTVEGSVLGFDSFVTASQVVDAETERGMQITGERRSSARNGTVGTLTLSFTWENFARVEGNELLLDDVYETDQGLWFEGLSSGQTLAIRSPSGYGFAEFAVSEIISIEDRQLNFEGPARFTNGTLQAVLVGDGGADDSGVPNNTTTPTPDPNSSDNTVMLVLGGFGVFAAVVAVLLLAIGRDGLATIIRDTESDQDTETPTGETGDSDSAGTAVAETEEPESQESEIDTELLSDEERVERLLEQNGGRMKQANIVKETGWSNAKVSQLLSAMEEEGRIDKLRIGRENLISFPEEDVTEIGDT